MTIIRRALVALSVPSALKNNTIDINSSTMKHILIIAMILSIFGCGDNGSKKLEGPFKYYEYRETTMRAYPHEYYRLEMTEEQGMTLSWAKVNSPVTVLRVPESAAQELKSLILEHKLYNLKDSYKPPFRVLDGYMWHLYFRFGSEGVSCSADNARPPKQLQEGIEAINAFFNRLIDASTEDDIIEVKEER